MMFSLMRGSLVRSVRRVAFLAEENSVQTAGVMAAPQASIAIGLTLRNFRAAGSFVGNTEITAHAVRGTYVKDGRFRLVLERGARDFLWPKPLSDVFPKT